MNGYLVLHLNIVFVFVDCLRQSPAGVWSRPGVKYLIARSPANTPSSHPLPSPTKLLNSTSLIGCPLLRYGGQHPVTLSSLLDILA